MVPIKKLNYFQLLFFNLGLNDDINNLNHQNYLKKFCKRIYCSPILFQRLRI